MSNDLPEFECFTDECEECFACLGCERDEPCDTGVLFHIWVDEDGEVRLV